MKFAIEIIETLQRTVVVEADNYEDAERKTRKAYEYGSIILDAENSCVTTDYANDTENYVDIFGKEIFEQMPEDHAFN